MKRIVIFLIITWAVSPSVQAQNQKMFNESILLNGRTSGASVIEEDEGYILFYTGTDQSERYRTVGCLRMNRELQIINNLIIDSSNANIEFQGGLPGLHYLKDGNYLCTGVKINWGQQTETAFSAIFDSSANLVKMNYHHFLGGSRFNSSYRLNDSTFVATGVTSSNHALVIKFNAKGENLMGRIYGASNEQFVAFNIRPGLLPNTHTVYGWRGPISGTMVHSILVIDSVGNPLLEKSFPTGYGGCRGETSFFDSTFVIAGMKYHPSTGLRDPIIRKIDIDGNIVWEKVVKTPYEWAHFSTNIIVEENGRIICAGREQTNDGLNTFLMAFSPEGDSLWRQTYNPIPHTNKDQQFYHLIKTKDGGFLMSGYSLSSNKQQQSLWLLKVDSLGCEEYNCAPASVAFEEEEAFELKIYPNPNNGQLFFEGLEQTPLPFSVIDLQGRNVFSGIYQGTGIELPGFMGNGIYILQLENRDGIHRKKFVLHR